MNYNCEFCQKFFSSKSNLIFHQKNARYCMEIREETSTEKYVCKFCQKNFANKYSLLKHHTRCSDKQIIELKEMHSEEISFLKKENREVKKKYKTLRREKDEIKKELEELRGELFEQKGIVSGMQKGPGKTYNAYIHPKLINLPINNISALTHEYMIEKVNDGILTYEKATKGYRGILEVICDLITHENDDGEIERNYVCTDVSRNSFHRLLESKKWKSDKGGRYLNNILDTFRDMMEEYKNKAYEIYNETPHDSFEWSQVDWERKNISLLYSGIVCTKGNQGREDLVNILRKEISKRASV